MKSLSQFPKRLFVLFNCQNRTLIQSLQRLLPDSQVSGMSTHQFILQQQRGEIDHRIDTDAFVLIRNGEDILGDHPCRAYLPEISPVSLSPIIFRGFHPDAVAMRKDSKGVAVLAGLHSQIVRQGYESGRSEEEIESDFNEANFRELGYFQIFRTEQKRLLEGFENEGLDMHEAYNRWMRDGVFMHTTNHPKPHVVFDLAVALCKREGWAFDPDVARFWRPLAEDFLINEIIWPVYPEIAEEIGFDGSYFFRFPKLTKLLSLQGFIRHELSCFKEAEVP
jgi:hypothetical protein